MNKHSYLVLFFTIYSFMGWTMETIYASKINKKFINRGFLKGPFCPIYGFGAILIISGSNLIKITNSSRFLESIVIILFAIIISTLLELVTGYILEKIFNLKWWDYSKRTFNIKGYICLEYSLLWGGIGFILLKIVHPVLNNQVLQLSDKLVINIAIISILYFLFDTIISVTSILDLRKTIFNHSRLSTQKYYEKILKYERYFLAFPRLLFLNIGIANRDIRKILNDKINKIKNEIKTKF